MSSELPAAGRGIEHRNFTKTPWEPIRRAVDVSGTLVPPDSASRIPQIFCHRLSSASRRGRQPRCKQSGALCLVSRRCPLQRFLGLKQEVAEAVGKPILLSSERPFSHSKSQAPLLQQWRFFLTGVAPTLPAHYLYSCQSETCAASCWLRNTATGPTQPSGDIFLQTGAARRISNSSHTYPMPQSHAYLILPCLVGRPIRSSAALRPRPGHPFRHRRRKVGT